MLNQELMGLLYPSSLYQVPRAPGRKVLLGLSIPKAVQINKRANTANRTGNYGVIVQATKTFLPTAWVTAPELAKILTAKMDMQITASSVRSNLMRLSTEGYAKKKKKGLVTYYARKACP